MSTATTPLTSRDHSRNIPASQDVDSFAAPIKSPRPNEGLSSPHSMRGGMRTAAANATAKSAEDMDGTVEDLRALCVSKGRPDLMDNFREVHLKALLQKHTLQKMFDYLERAVAEFAKMRDVTDIGVDRAMFQKVLDSGAFVVRGRDKQNRPILWVREGRYPRGVKMVDSLHLVLWTWFARHAAMSRPPGVAFFTIVLDESNRPPLGFQFESTIKVLETLKKVFLPGAMIGQVIIASAGWGFKTLHGLVKKVKPSIRGLPMVALDQREHIFDHVQNRRDVPDYFIRGLGSPVEVNEVTAGRYDLYLFGNEPISMREIFNHTGPARAASKTPTSSMSPTTVTTGLEPIDESAEIEGSEDYSYGPSHGTFGKQGGSIEGETLA